MEKILADVALQFATKLHVMEKIQKGVDGAFCLALKMDWVK